MHRPTSKTLTLLFALTLAACKTEDGGSYGAVPKDEAPKTYADLYCDLLQTCDCNFPVTPEQCVEYAKTLEPHGELTFQPLLINRLETSWWRPEKYSINSGTIFFRIKSSICASCIFPNR